MKVNRNKTPYFKWYEDDDNFTREHYNRLFFNLYYVFCKRFKDHQFFKIKTDEPGTKPIYVKIGSDVGEILTHIHSMLQCLYITEGYEVYGLRNSNGISIVLRAWGEDEDDKLRFEFIVTPCAESKYIKHCTAGHE